jgi:hypothetical protein
MNERNDMKLIDLQKELNRLKGNAVRAPKPSLLPWEEDAYFELWNEAEINFDQSLSFHQFDQLIRKYGRIISIGDTIAPINLISENLDGSYSIKNADELGLSDLEEIENLIDDLRYFNNYIINFYQNAPEELLDYLRSNFKDKLEANKRKYLKSNSP